MLSIPDSFILLFLAGFIEQIIDNIVKDDISLGLRVAHHSILEIVIWKEQHSWFICLTDNIMLPQREFITAGLAFIQTEDLPFF